MNIADRYKKKFTSKLEVMGLMEYLEEAKVNKEMYLNPAERLLKAIGEPQTIDTRKYTKDPGLGRLYNNQTIRLYPSISDLYLGQYSVIDNLVSFLRSAERGLEASKQILYLLGPVGGGKSTISEILKRLMEKEPFYALAVEINKHVAVSPIHENPLGLFSPSDEDELGIPGYYLSGRISSWMTKRLEELEGDISKLKVVKLYPDESRHIALAKTEPGDENNQDISSLVGKIDVSKMGDFTQSDPDAYDFSGGLCRGNRGMLEFVEMFKAPIKMLHPLLTATQERNYNPTENAPSIPFEGIILAHSNIEEWEKFSNDPKNEAFIDRTHVIKVPYEMRKDNVIKIYQQQVDKGALKGAARDPNLLDVASDFHLMAVLNEDRTAKRDTDILTKIKTYNGENVQDEVPGARTYQEHKEDENNRDEGMDSPISLRDMFKLLADTYDKPQDELSASTVDFLTLLDKHIDTKIEDDETRKVLLANFKILQQQFLIKVGKDIQQAYIGDTSSYAQKIFKNYLDMAEAWLKERDFTDDNGDRYNSSMLDSSLSKLEKRSNGEKLVDNPKGFRQEMVDYALTYRANNQGNYPSWDSYAKIADVIKAQLLVDFDKYIPVIMHDNVKSTEDKEVLENFTRAMKKQGYTPRMIRQLLQFWDKRRK